MLFEGVATAMITPFKDGKLDPCAFERLLDRQLQAGVNAVVVNGTTGEPATLTSLEKETLLKIAVKRLKGKLPIIAGAGSNGTQNSIQACKIAEDIGADGLLVVTPYYNKCTQLGLVRHFTAIAESTSLPVILYNVPSRTGVNLLPATVAELAKVKNIVAVKEASGNMEQIEQCLATGIDVYSGDDAITLPIMAMGGRGVISVASNIYPEYLAQMTLAALSGDIKKASRMQLDLLPLVKALFCEVNPIPVKRAAELLGLCDGELRLPLTPLSPENTAYLKREMTAFDRLLKQAK